MIDAIEIDDAGVPQLGKQHDFCCKLSEGSSRSGTQLLERHFHVIVPHPQVHFPKVALLKIKKGCAFSQTITKERGAINLSYECLNLDVGELQVLQGTK